MSVGQTNLSGIRVLDNPVDPTEKARYVADMFDAIAPRYDLLNAILSGRLDQSWRRFAARCAALTAGDSALDVCSGTGDFARELRKSVGRSGRVVATDFSSGMLESGRAKFAADDIAVQQADATNLPFPDQQFDAAVVGFGLRNIALPGVALSEMCRVVRPLGRVVCLEFSHPTGEDFGSKLFKSAFGFFSRTVLPTVGRLVSGSSEAYKYLPESMARWKSRDEISELMRQAGLVDIRTRDLTFGLVCVHVGVRPS
jgi:demethylmenaquinone methyltransferase / 2-methoxy-6-polyprenyl-1,4-benzoquinol methylase